MIKKLKQYYLDIISCLHFTGPIYFIAFTVNSLSSFPLTSTPSRLETVCSTLFWSPSHTLRCRSLGVGTKSAASCSPSMCEWAHCTNQRAMFPGGYLHGLLGQGTCFPADQTQKIKAASHSALITHCCLAALKRCVLQTWSLSWGAGSVVSANCLKSCACSPCLWPSNQSESKPGSISVTKFGIHLHELQLTERIWFRASCPGCPSGEGEIPAPLECRPSHLCLRQVSHAERINQSSEVFVNLHLLAREPGQPV